VGTVAHYLSIATQIRIFAQRSPQGRPRVWRPGRASTIILAMVGPTVVYCKILEKLGEVGMGVVSKPATCFRGTSR